MASPSRTTTGSLIEELIGHPYRFQFFQALRILQIRWARCGSQSEGNLGGIGGDVEPRREFAKLQGMVEQAFPSCEIASVEFDPETGVPRLSVAVMGLYGATGVLPLHDKQRLIDQRSDPTCERAFLDLLNHRLLSMFFRAWVKHWLPIQFEQTYGRIRGDSDVDRREPDAVSGSLLSLAGIGTPALRNRTSVPDTRFGYFAGHFARTPKNASSLRQMIEAVFGTAATIRECVARWLQLDRSSRSEMAGPLNPRGRNAALGAGFVVGDRVRDVSSKFRIELGPLEYPQLLAFSPLGRSFCELVELTRMYVGPSLDFDVLLELKADAIPGFELGDEVVLGVNSWVYSIRPESNSRDAVFNAPA